jgi:zinc transport system substrate-binding protein
VPGDGNYDAGSEESLGRVYGGSSDKGMRRLPRAASDLRKSAEEKNIEKGEEMKSLEVSVVILLLIGALFILFNPLMAEDAKKVDVFVSITPEAYFVDRIGGEYVNTNVLVGPGQSPETYEPTVKQMAGLADCDVYFRIGVPFEKQLLKKLSETLPDLNVSNTIEGLRLRPMEVLHDQGDKAEGAGARAGAPDPHVWLDPMMARILADNMYRELCWIDSLHKDKYTENVVKLQHDLDSLNHKIMTILAAYKGHTFMVFHPILGYFADRYGLKQLAVEIEGKEPGARQLTELIELAREKGVKTIFVQPQFSSKSAKRIAEAIGGKIETLDGLAYDYMNNLAGIAQKLAEGFKSGE